MKDYLKERTLEIADHVVLKRCTVRDAAKVFNVSKSTVHCDLTERLKNLDLARFYAVSEVLSYNLSVRHLRGGEVTKMRYKKRR